MITCRFHLLHEKFHILLRVTKETVLLKKCLRVIMVNVACHDIKRNISAGFIRYVHRVTDELLKQKQLPVDSDIECSLRSVRSETCSLPPARRTAPTFSFRSALIPSSWNSSLRRSISSVSTASSGANTPVHSRSPCAQSALTQTSRSHQLCLQRLVLRL